MLFKTEKRKYLFKQIKNGDFLAFYHKPYRFIFSQLIKFVTGNKLDHVAGVFDVERRDGVVIFKLGEQVLAHGKIVKKYSIVKIDEESFNIDSRFNQDHIDFYLLPNKNKITATENIKLRKYWSDEEDSDYKLTELPATINWIHKIIVAVRKLFGKKAKIYDNNCSTAARQSMIELGIQDNKFDDKVPNPTEFAKFSFIREIVKIIK